MNQWDKFAEKLERLEHKAFCRQRYVEENGTFCAIGAFIPEYASVIRGSSHILRPHILDSMAIIEGEGGNTALTDDEDVKEEARELLHTLLHKRTGLDKFELNMVQQWNDAYNGRPENRYAHV